MLQSRVGTFVALVFARLFRYNKFIHVQCNEQKMSIENKVLVLKLYSSGFRVKLKFVINSGSTLHLPLVSVSRITLE